MNNILYNLIKENEGLVYKLAHKYSEYYEIDDLYQAGCMGIVKAYNNYKDNSSCKFSSYAYKYILGEMIDFIRKDRNIIMSDDAYLLYKKYLKIKDLLCEKYDREVSFSDICKYMNIDENYMLMIIESISNGKSFSSNELVDYLCIDNRESIDEKILINSNIENLSDYEKSLITLRYYQDLSQEETAKILGVNQVKVSRSEKLILQKLKNNIK